MNPYVDIIQEKTVATTCTSNHRRVRLPTLWWVANLTAVFRLGALTRYLFGINPCTECRERWAEYPDSKCWGCALELRNIRRIEAAADDPLADRMAACTRPGYTPRIGIVETDEELAQLFACKDAR